MIKEQSFGGEWTEKKLDAVDNYLKFFTTVLKKQKFKLCYIDAFSGSGNVTLRNGSVIDGSAIRALKYPFDEYFFIEKKKAYYDALCKKVEEDYSERADIVNISQGDSNKLLQNINSRQWRANGWRGVIFLDPYAMDLDWESLKKISETKAFDVWYLFPFSAVQRNLKNDGRISEANEKKLNKIFGTTDWKEQLYAESQQMTLFGNSEQEKIPDGLKQFIVKRLGETFPIVADKPAILKNKTNSPLFLLCFAVSNPDSTAKVALKGADYILKSMED